MGADRETIGEGRQVPGTRADPPLVAIVGRPNVGKSTLFNRLVGLRKALVKDVPGVTRDPLMGRVEWGEVAFRVMDTGGLETGEGSVALSGKIRSRIEKAVEEAALLLLVVDGRSPVHPEDVEIVRLLRRRGKPMVCAVNKVDTEGRRDMVYPYYRLGVEPLLAISAEHGLGMGDLLDRVVRMLPEAAGEERPGEESPPIRVAIVGRPNVGKSTLVNALLGEDRQLVDPEPGTTRDAVDAPFTWRGTRFLLVDTAGIRKKGKVTASLERLSVMKAFQSIDRCDVALLMMDAREGVTDQEAQIGRIIVEKGKGVVAVVNKWDLVEGTEGERGIIRRIRDHLPHLDFAPVVTLSALRGTRLETLLGRIEKVTEAYRSWVPTGPINRVLEEAVAAHPPPSDGTRMRRLQYITQIKTAPPTFLVFGNRTRQVPPSYERFLVHRIRDRFGFEGVPVRLLFRRKRR